MEKNKSFNNHIMGYKPSNLTILHLKLSYVQNYLHPSCYKDNWTWPHLRLIGTSFRVHTQKGLSSELQLLLTIIVLFVL